MKFCFYCGYDLAGLELPRNCPECGTCCDPKRDADRAREWFTTSNALHGLLFFKSKIPLGVHYLLDDNQCRKVAARRRFKWIILPMITIFVITLVGSSIDVTYNAHVAYHLKRDQTQTPVFQYDYELGGRALDRNPKPTNFDAHKIAAWKSVVARGGGTTAINHQERRVGKLTIKRPAMFTRLAPLWIIPFGALICAYYAGRFTLINLVRRTTDVPDRQSLARSIANLEIVTTYPVGISAWMWALILVGTIFVQIGWLPAVVASALKGLTWWATIYAIFFAVIAYPSLVLADRPRKIMRRSVLNIFAILLIQAGIIFVACAYCTPLVF